VQTVEVVLRSEEGCCWRGPIWKATPFLLKVACANVFVEKLKRSFCITTEADDHFARGLRTSAEHASNLNLGRRGLDSNYRYRFLNSEATAFRESQREHTIVSQSPDSD
jgi:hypothetical protein